MQCVSQSRYSSDGHQPPHQWERLSRATGQHLGATKLPYSASHRSIKWTISGHWGSRWSRWICSGPCSYPRNRDWARRDTGQLANILPLHWNFEIYTHIHTHLFVLIFWDFVILLSKYLLQSALEAEKSLKCGVGCLDTWVLTMARS